MALTLDEARSMIDQVLDGYRRASRNRSVLPTAVTAGKTYEAWILCRVLERLHVDEGFEVELMDSSMVRLKSSPGPINRGYCHFLLTRPGTPDLEVWTDIEFTGLSARLRGATVASSCDYHELDVVVVPAGTRGRPSFDRVLIGVECKNLTYRKDMLRGLLGVRRELSLLTDDQATLFQVWPRNAVPAHPPSALLSFGTDPRIVDFAPPGKTFGIDFVYEPLP